MRDKKSSGSKIKDCDAAVELMAWKCHYISFSSAAVHHRTQGDTHLCVYAFFYSAAVAAV